MGSIRKRFDPPCEEMIIGANYRREKGRVFESIDLNHNGFVDENENALKPDDSMSYNANTLFCNNARDDNFLVCF